MKSVLISIQPKWCELIANGQKTVEVRKTKPKLDTPFKCYVYCTQGKDVLAVSRYSDKSAFLWNKSDVDRYNADMVRNGKVIGEFVCYNIFYLNEADLFVGMDEINKSVIEECSCVDIDELLHYKGDKNEIYGWEVSELVMYDKPKELREFFMYCGDNPKCDKCEAHYYSNTECGKEDYCCSIIDGHRPLKRPPQSWCYVKKGGAE